MSEVCLNISCVQLFNLTVYSCTFFSLVCLREYGRCIKTSDYFPKSCCFPNKQQQEEQTSLPAPAPAPRVTDLLAFPGWSRCLASPDNPVKLNLSRCGLQARPWP